jgi:PAS domain S-box-containing protein
VAVGIPKALATVRAERLLGLALAAFGLSGLMAVLIAVAGTEVFFLGPLATIANTAQRMRRGDLTARTGMRQRGDELNQLAETIDEMAAALQAREQDVSLQHERLANQERRFRVLIENSADGIALVGPDDTFHYVSPSIGRILGYESADLVTQHRLTLVHPDDRERQQASTAELLERPGGVASGIVRLRHKDGSWRWIESVHTNLLSDPAVHAIVSNCRDITARLEAEEGLVRVFEELEARVADRTADLVAANTRLADEIVSRTRAETALRRLNLALENEAGRIGAALHDDAGQLLAVAHNTLADLERDLPAEARDRLQELRTHLDSIESQLHHLSHELRPRVLEDLGLVGGIEFLAGSVSRRTGIPVKVDVAIDGRYDPLVETALYRVTQEALNNVARHSKATRVEVVFRQNGHGVHGTIADDGCGFDAPAALNRRGDASLGLRGMQDRLEAVRGRLEIVTEPDGGTAVHVAIPLEDVNVAPSTAR